MAGNGAQDPERTADLLERWHTGDSKALDEFLARNLTWVEDYVRRRLGRNLRAKEETADLVQDAGDPAANGFGRITSNAYRLTIDNWKSESLFPTG